MGERKVEAVNFNAEARAAEDSAEPLRKSGIPAEGSDDRVQAMIEATKAEEAEKSKSDYRGIRIRDSLGKWS